MKGAVVTLFSGGTDSTLTAAMLGEAHEKVHLVTYDRLGFHATGNTEVNAKMLQDHYGRDRFSLDFIRVEKLFRFIAYERYTRNVFKHGFFNLSTCGLCKLAMHARTVKYCLDNGLEYATDGANKGMSMFPAQMEPVINELRKMYAHFGIDYFNPVFDLTAPDEGDYIDDVNAQFLEKLTVSGVKDNPSEAAQDHTTISLTPQNTPQQTEEETPAEAPESMTPGEKLYQIGLAPTPNVKGSAYDRKRQPRCFQFVIFNVFAHKYFMANREYDDYVDGTVRFYKEKIERTVEVLEANHKEGKHAQLFE